VIISRRRFTRSRSLYRSHERWTSLPAFGRAPRAPIWGDCCASQEIGQHFCTPATICFDPLLAPLRTALELDRFGIVAHLLGDQGCTPERCDALMRFHDSSKALANFRNHTFEEQVKKALPRRALNPEVVGLTHESPDRK
jgi:hypothetical protein